MARPAVSRSARSSSGQTVAPGTGVVKASPTTRIRGTSGAGVSAVADAGDGVRAAPDASGALNDGGGGRFRVRTDRRTIAATPRTMTIHAHRGAGGNPPNMR